MYFAYKWSKQGDNIQPWRTPFPIWNQFVVSCPVLTVASWPVYRFLKRQVRWSGIPLLGYFKRHRFWKPHAREHALQQHSQCPEMKANKVHSKEEMSGSRNGIRVHEGIWHALWNKEIMSSEVQISDNQNQWRREDESCVIGFTFQMGQTRLLAVSTLTKIKWTPSDGNFLMLSKGDKWEEVLRW